MKEEEIDHDGTIRKNLDDLLIVKACVKICKNEKFNLSFSNLYYLLDFV